MRIVILGVRPMFMAFEITVTPIKGRIFLLPMFISASYNCIQFLIHAMGFKINK